MGCGETVEVPPAHIGKLSTSSGLQKGVIQPGRLRLDLKWGMYQTLVLIEAADCGVKETMEVYMPKDNLNLTMEVRGTLSVSADEENVDKVISRVAGSVIKDNYRIRIIDNEEIYRIYAEPVVREVARSVVAAYSIDELMLNRELTGQKLEEAIRKELASTPFTVVRFGLANVQPPRVIVDAQESRKRREVEILEAESKKLIALQQAEAALQVAFKQQEVDLKEAETQVMVDQKLAEGINRAFVTQRALKVLETMAQSPNKVFFLPQEVMTNPMLLLGPVQDALKDDKDAAAVALSKN
ncbi:MAG: SPFH domain-containing protein [Patescibacteria group bacterium]